MRFSNKASFCGSRKTMRARFFRKMFPSPSMRGMSAFCASCAKSLQMRSFCSFNTSWAISAASKTVKPFAHKISAAAFFPAAIGPVTPIRRPLFRVPLANEAPDKMLNGTRPSFCRIPRSPAAERKAIPLLPFLF